MIEQVGLVRRLDGKNVELEIMRAAGCGGGCSSCGASCESTAHIVSLPNKVNAKVGDVVEIKGESNKIMKFTAMVYIIPLVFLVIGVGLGTAIFKSISPNNYEGLSLLMGILFLAISAIILKSIDKRVDKNESPLTVTKIL